MSEQDVKKMKFREDYLTFVKCILQGITDLSSYLDSFGNLTENNFNLICGKLDDGFSSIFAMVKVDDSVLPIEKINPIFEEVSKFAGNISSSSVKKDSLKRKGDDDLYKSSLIQKSISLSSLLLLILHKQSLTLLDYFTQFVNEKGYSMELYESVFIDLFGGSSLEYEVEEWNHTRNILFRNRIEEKDISCKIDDYGILYKCSKDLMPDIDIILSEKQIISSRDGFDALYDNYLAITDALHRLCQISSLELVVNDKETKKSSNLKVEGKRLSDAQLFAKNCEKLDCSEEYYPTIQHTVDYWAAFMTSYDKSITFEQIMIFRNSLQEYLADILHHGDEAKIGVGGEKLFGLKKACLAANIDVDLFSRISPVGLKWPYKPGTSTSVTISETIEDQIVLDYVLTPSFKRTLDYWIYKLERTINNFSPFKITVIRQMFQHVLKDYMHAHPGESVCILEGEMLSFYAKLVDHSTKIEEILLLFRNILHNEEEVQNKTDCYTITGEEI